MKRNNAGFSIIELLIVLSVLAIISGFIFSTFISFRNNQSLSLDTQTVTSLLRQARNQTLSSKNSNTFGVHFGTNTITLFVGSAYNSSDPTNENFSLSSNDTVLTVALSGGGSDVVFKKLTGETSQDGTVVISNPGLSQTKTVTIYKTGLIDSQ